MRLQRLSLRNFRCFDEAEIDLSSDIIALYGRNGVGKTAIFDALEFGLLGSIGRFEAETEPPDYIGNVHTAGNVEIRIEFSDNSWIRVGRDRGAKPKTELETSLGTKNRRAFLYKAVVAREYSPARKEISAVADLFRSTVLLSQHSIRSFIEGKPEERSRVISNLAGSAYFQRCLDKAGAVQKEAGKKEAIEQSALDVLTAQLIEAKSVVGESDSRIAAAREGLGTDSVQFSSIAEALDAASFPVKISEPQNSDEAEALLASLGSVRDELSIDLDTRSNLLSELFSLALSQPETLRRREELRKNIQDSNAKLGEAQKREGELQETTVNQDRSVRALDSRIAEIERHLTSLKDLEIAATRRDQLERDLLSVSASLSTLNEEERTLTESSKRFENELVSARQRLGTSEQLLARTISEHSALRDMSASFERYSQANVRIRDANARHQELQLKRGAIESQQLEVNGRLRSIEEHVSELNRRRSLIVDKAQEASHLLSQLRNHVEGRQCPMCGHSYGSQQELLAAIEERLRFIPPEIQEITRTEQSLTEDLDTTKTKLARLSQEIEGLDKEIERASEESLGATRESRSFEEKASRVGVSLESSTIEISIAEHERAIEKIRQTVNELEQQTSDLDAQRSLTTGRLELVRARLVDEREHQSQMNQELESVKLSIVRLRLDGIELDPTREKQESITSQLESERVARAGELSKKAATQDQLRSTKIETANERANIDRWQLELSGIVREIDSYETKCRALDLSENASSETIDQARLALNDRKKALERASTLLEQYALSLRVAALEEARVLSHTELTTIEAQVSAHEANRKKYLEVVRQSSGWISELSRNIDNVVERRIESHAPEINRLFRSMIPTPYLYEGVAISRRNKGLRLGLRYAGLKNDSGEPKFFLSNAQANVLALSMFLSFALRNHWTKLQSILLDDPIQHLDDLDAVAFLDNVRSVALGSIQRKQIILSTCDQDLYLLMIRKFRLLKPNGVRFTAISLSEKSIGTPQINYDVGGPSSLLRQVG